MKSRKPVFIETKPRASNLRIFRHSLATPTVHITLIQKMESCQTVAIHCFEGNGGDSGESLKAGIY